MTVSRKFSAPASRCSIRVRLAALFFVSSSRFFSVLQHEKKRSSDRLISRLSIFRAGLALAVNCHRIESEIVITPILSGYYTTRSLRVPGRRTLSQPSVIFGCPVPACDSHTTFLVGSGTYHTRAPPVTSYCHCSSSSPPTDRVPRSPLRRCCRVGFVGVVGPVRSFVQHSFVGPGADLHNSSQPLIASLVRYLTSHSPFPAGGATRSWRFGTIEWRPGDRD